MPNNKSIFDTKEYDRTQAAIQLMSELAKGEKSGCTQGWILAENMRVYFTEKSNGQA